MNEIYAIKLIALNCTLLKTLECSNDLKLANAKIFKSEIHHSIGYWSSAKNFSWEILFANNLQNKSSNRTKLEPN